MWLYPILKSCSKIPGFPGCLRIRSQHLAFTLNTNKINHTWCKYSKPWMLECRTLELKIKVYSD